VVAFVTFTQEQLTLDELLHGSTSEPPWVLFGLVPLPPAVPFVPFVEFLIGNYY
jgi:hypothetical protein